MHSVLARQIKKTLGETTPVSKELEALLVLVSDAYTHYDEDRAMIERSLEISSREMGELNAKLREESALSRSQADQLASQVAELEKVRAGMLNLLEDIEDEKGKAETMVVARTKELSDEKARLLASINSLSFGFILADTNHNIELKNRALRKILDLPRDPKTVHDVTQAFSVVGLGSVEFNLADSCSQCIDFQKTLEMKEVSYGQKFLRILCAPISNDPTGQVISKESVIGYVILIEDITEAKVMERSRDEFFAVASHELRTPLTAIRGNADMILDMYADKIVDTDMKEMLTDIDISSVRLIDIVNDFLEVSRLEQGRIVIKKEDFEITDVVDKVLRDLSTTVTNKGLKLLYTPPAVPLPHVLSDKNRVEQILVNLVGNALKFTKEGSITIELAQLANFIKVTVTDTGIGVSEHNQTLLFRKFQQAGEQMLARDVTQGTGLGLYICRHLIGYLGGTIGLERSEMGKGSVFAFTVPTMP